MEKSLAEGGGGNENFGILRQEKGNQVTEAIVGMRNPSLNDSRVF